MITLAVDHDKRRLEEFHRIEYDLEIKKVIRPLLVYNPRLTNYIKFESLQREQYKHNLTQLFTDSANRLGVLTSAVQDTDKATPEDIWTTQQLSTLYQNTAGIHFIVDEMLTESFKRQGIQSIRTKEDFARGLYGALATKGFRKQYLTQANITELVLATQGFNAAFGPKGLQMSQVITDIKPSDAETFDYFIQEHRRKLLKQVDPKHIGEVDPLFM